MSIYEGHSTARASSSEIASRHHFHVLKVQKRWPHFFHHWSSLIIDHVTIVHWSTVSIIHGQTQVKNIMFPSRFHHLYSDHFVHFFHHFSPSSSRASWICHGKIHGFGWRFSWRNHSVDLRKWGCKLDKKPLTVEGRCLASEKWHVPRQRGSFFGREVEAKNGVVSVGI